MKKGLLNISVGIILIFFSSISALLISYLLSDAIDIRKKTIEAIDHSYSKILSISGANIWKKFLTDNGAYWDFIQSESEETNKANTQLVFNSYIKYNLIGNDSTINYTVVSTTTTYIYSEKYINVVLEFFKNGIKQPIGMSIDFGWPGI